MQSSKLRILTITSLAHFINDGTFLLYPLLIVYYSTVLKVSIVFLGTFAVVYTLLSGLLSPLIGNYADTHNLDAELLFSGILLEAISIIIFALPFTLPSFSYFLIAIATIILGAGQAFYHPIGGAVLSRVFGKSSGGALGLNGAFGSIGRSVTPSIVTALILLTGYFLGLTWIALYMIVASLVILFGLRFHRKERMEQVRKVNEKLDRKFYKFLIILGIAVFVRSMFITGTTNFLGDFVYDVYHSKTLAGIFLTVGFLGSIVGQPFFGKVTEWKGGFFSYTLTSVISLVTFGLYLALAHNLILSSVIYTILTFAAFTSFPVLLGYVSQVFPKSFFTVANSYIWGIGVTVGGSAGTALITLLLDMHYSLFFSFIIMLVLSAISTAMIPLIPRKRM
ncbi:MFS transporter [Sulfolobales archaeon HS-7]|nr:MFS transporter [Sulfolobales archaeon HS-7]